MTFDLIIIGNELLNGKIQDLNTHFLAQELHKRGHKLRKVHLIGDNEHDFKTSLDEAIINTDFIISSGGLGPTLDDITKRMLGSYFGKRLVFNQDALDITLSQYSRGNKEYNQEKMNYQQIPEGFRAIYNPTGYAPGLFFEVKGTKVLATPGVPSEFQTMLLEEVLPKLVPKSKLLVKHITVKTWKIPEAKIFHKLSPDLWEQLESFGEVSSLPHYLGVDIGIKIEANAKDKMLEMEKSILNIIKTNPLNEYIWHIGPESIEEVIVTKAKAKNLTIGFAESCTGGLCASRITDISGSSAVFWGSIVSYANEVKQNSLKVSSNTLTTKGAVSKETALEMALGAREQLKVDIAVTTTGIAGPGGATEGKPVGTIGIGVASKNGSSSDIHNFQGSRTMLKQIFSQAALMVLLEEINSHE